MFKLSPFPLANNESGDGKKAAAQPSGASWSFVLEIRRVLFCFQTKSSSLQIALVTAIAAAPPLRCAVDSFAVILFLEIKDRNNKYSCRKQKCQSVSAER